MVFLLDYGNGCLYAGYLLLVAFIYVVGWVNTCLMRSLVNGRGRGGSCELLGWP